VSADVYLFDQSDSPHEQARGWIVRIDSGALTADERRQLSVWLAQDPLHRELLDEYALLWAAAGAAMLQSTSPSASPSTLRQLRPTWPVRRVGWTVASVCTALVVFVLGWQGSFTEVSRDVHIAAPVTHHTKVGEKRWVGLLDGSTTSLGAASSLRVAYTAERRRVVLERGIALFDVVADKFRPFEVEVQGTIVRAVGTRFLVSRHEDGRVEVTVYEGIVQVDRPRGPAAVGHDADAPGAYKPDPVRLGMGQTATTRNELIVVSVDAPSSLQRKLAWQDDRLVFDQTPLSDALEEVNRYSAKPIRLQSPDLRSVQISGAFSSNQVHVLLSSLEQGFALQVTETAEAWVVSRATAGP